MGRRLFAKTPSGIMNSEQARVLANIAQNYGRNIIDLTTRQAVQFHWLRVENLWDVMEQLDKVNLDTVEACGDCPRTVIGNPLSGIEQIADIGLRGTLRKSEGKTSEFFEVSVGGILGKKSCFAKQLEGKIPAERLFETIKSFLCLFKNRKMPDESFHDFVSRVGVEEFQALINS
jgi:Sulfite reductase, beta subunit (hemoprotein)